MTGGNGNSRPRERPGYHALSMAKISKIVVLIIMLILLKIITDQLNKWLVKNVGKTNTVKVKKHHKNPTSSVNQASQASYKRRQKLMKKRKTMKKGVTNLKIT